MAGSATAALNAAMYAAAIGDSELSALVTGVLQFVPEGQTFPYIEFGMSDERPDNAHDSFGAETRLFWHVWDRSRDPDTANEITDRLIAIFDHQPLSLTGHRLVAMRLEQALTVNDPDPEIRHVSVRFRANTEEQ